MDRRTVLKLLGLGAVAATVIKVVPAPLQATLDIPAIKGIKPSEIGMFFVEDTPIGYVTTLLPVVEQPMMDFGFGHRGLPTSPKAHLSLRLLDRQEHYLQNWVLGLDNSHGKNYSRSGYFSIDDYVVHIHGLYPSKIDTNYDFFEVEIMSIVEKHRLAAYADVEFYYSHVEFLRRES